MKNVKLNLKFERYLPINYEPYYVFTTTDRYLVSCKDYPQMIGKLAPYQEIKVECILGNATEYGVRLKNIGWL